MGPKYGDGNFCNIIDTIYTSYIECTRISVFRDCLDVAVDVEMQGVKRFGAQVEESLVIGIDVGERPRDSFEIRF
jgi:hypothetical protein